MKVLFVFCLALFLASSHALKNYVGTDLQKCINCLCHARTGCFNRFNCANYSIGFDYWKKAKSPVVDANDDPDAETSYKKCLQNENCILATIDQYADEIGRMDCNCDGEFDCKDRFAIHLFGANCANPTYTKQYADRFNGCSARLGVRRMFAKEGSEGCTPEVF